MVGTLNALPVVVVGAETSVEFKSPFGRRMECKKLRNMDHIQADYNSLTRHCVQHKHCAVTETGV